MIKKQQPLVRRDQKIVHCQCEHCAKERRAGTIIKSQENRIKRPVSGPKCSRCGRSPPHDRKTAQLQSAMLVTSMITTKQCAGHQTRLWKSTKKPEQSWLRWSFSRCSKEWPLDSATPGDEWDNWLSHWHQSGGERYPEQVYKKLGSLPLTSPSQTLRRPSNELLPVKGWFTAKLVHEDRDTEQEVYIVEWLHRPLLRRPVIESLQLVHWVWGVQPGKLNPLQQFPSLFQGLGKLSTPSVYKKEQNHMLSPLLDGSQFHWWSQSKTRLNT